MANLPGLPVTKYASISASAQTVTLGSRKCKTLQISLTVGSADMYITFDGTTPTVGGATTFRIEGGGSWSSHPNANLGVDNFKYIGSAATGSYSVVGA